MNVIDWLLDSDPAIRWQVMRDLTDEAPDAVAAERQRVTTEGWGAQLLALQPPDGVWGGGACFPEWTSTQNTLVLLKAFGLDPHSRETQHAVELVRQNCRWEHAGQPFFEGEVEPCINGRLVAVAAYFGQDAGPVVERLLGEQMADGGWNCEQENGSARGSFDTTIDVLEGLLEYEQTPGDHADVTAARLRGQKYLLERGLLRRRSTGEIVNPAYTRFFFPTYWHYDALRGLDYLRAAGVKPDDRVAEALDLVRQRRGEDGRWLLEFVYPGEVYLDMDEGAGKPSRWNTLRALRVLRWADGDSAPSATHATTN